MKLGPTIPQLTFLTRKGRETETVFDDLAALRIAVFHDYPYLYEGNIVYEKAYLKTYSNASCSFLFAVYHDQRMVGATTCIPLVDEMAEVRQPFEDAGLNIKSIFYFGESILLPAFRGLGLGHRFFDEREAHVRSFGVYDLCCFCSVERGENHPKKPMHYRSNDAFWLKRGFKKEASLQSSMAWPDIGETESSFKKMTFWIKQLSVPK